MRKVVGTWLMKLVVLYLPNAPAAASVDKTAQVWCEALMATPIAWDEAMDAPRIDAAFRSLLPRLERFPLPKHVLDAMPARPEQVKLPAPPATEAERERARVMLASITKKLRMPQHESGSPEKLRTPKARG